MAPGDPQTRITCSAMRREDNRLLFSNKGGPIAYSGHGHSIRFFFELAVPGVLVYFPQELAGLSDKDRQVVVAELDEWLLKEMRLVPKLPDILEEEDEDIPCLFKGCGRRRLKGRYICRYHYLERAPSFEPVIHYLET
jgi:hypothetical protein